MKRKLLAATVVASFGAAWVVDAVAQVKPEILVKQRQAAMTLQGKYFGPLAGMAQGKLPYDANIVQRNAGYLQVLDKMPWDGFDPSTKNVTVKTGALPAIWNEPAKFKEAAERLQSEVSRLASMSKGGDEGAVKAQIGAVGKACNDCHDNFREKQ